jgi:hypothetical protein
MKNLSLKMINRYLLYLVLALLALILATTGFAVSCENGCKSGYKAFAFGEDDVRFTIGGVILEHPLFTFEYPCSFGLVDINRFPDFVYSSDVTAVDFTRYEEGNTFPEETIELRVHKPGIWGDTDAKTSVDNVIASDSGNPDYQNFQILERTVVNVDDIPAEYVTYSYHRPAKEGFGFSTQERVIRFVAFDYEGFLWKLKMNCFVESAEETEPYFDHLIETFDIIK